MALKVAIAQSAARSGTGTQDFTDSGAGFSSDVKAAVFIATKTTANHTNATDQRFQFSIAANNGGSAAHSIVNVDGATTNNWFGRYSNNNSTNQDAYNYVAVGGGSSAEFDIDSWLSTGVRVNWVADPSEAGELISCLLLGGDIEASVVHGTFSAGTTATAAHGLGGAPEVIIVLCGTTTSTAGNSGAHSIGFWAASTSTGVGFMGGYSGAGANVGLNLSSTYVAMEVAATSGVLQNAGFMGGVSITVDSTNINLTSTQSNSDIVSFLCLRGTSTAITAKTGFYTTPTSTGDSAMGIALGAAPQVLLAFQSRMTATGAAGTDDAGSIGLIAAVNNAGTYQYGGATSQTNIDSSPQVCDSESTNSQAIRVLAVDGTPDVEATIKASSGWGASDVTLNFSNVAASAFQIPYLAFGIAALTPTITPKASFYRMLRSA